MGIKYNPFNPQQPARPNFFVGREPERKNFDTFLSQTTHSSPMNMSITGDRGMGKTSILLKFEEVAKENNCLVIRLSNYEGSVNDIMEFSDFLNLNIQRELISKNMLSKGLDSITKMINSLKPSVSWKDFAVSIEKKQIIQELLRERLIHLWRKIKDKYKAIVILIDEAESLEKIDALTFLREIFQRVDSEADYMIVLAGKLNFPERMSESFSPLNRFFPVNKLKKLGEKNVFHYIKSRLKETNTEIEENALSLIYGKSGGHPYVLVSMCYIIFDSLNDNENVITLDIVKRSMDKVKGRLSQDFFTPMFHPLTPKAKKILCSIAKKVNRLSFNFKEAQEWTDLKSNHLSPYILEMIRKGTINKPRRGEYEIFHSLFKEYLIEMSEY